MIKVGITGNIASGKSQAEDILRDRFPVYDTDKMTHEILDSFTDFFGLDVFTDGKLDRKKLGKIVFSNKDYKIKLENIIHPKIKENIIRIFKRHRDDKLVFISVPLLYESGFETLFDKVILITVDSDIQLMRLMKRNNFTKEEALNRIKSQVPQEEKIIKSDYIIENNSSIDELRIKINDVINELIQQ